jgi:hypothetical protein
MQIKREIKKQALRPILREEEYFHGLTIKMRAQG